MNSDDQWDVISIGAGVAGASVALLSARLGLKTLLVDAKAFPREKVCGGCLNLRAQESLMRLGLLDPLISGGANWLDRFELHVGRARGRWTIPRLLSVCRSTLDSFLVQQAIRAGVCFLPACTATVRFLSEPAGAWRRVALRQGADGREVRGKIVVVADGLTRSSLRENSRFESKREADSRIGVQAILPNARCPVSLPRHTLRMLVAPQGYLGMSGTDADRVTLAAAISPSLLRGSENISAAIERLISSIETEPIDLSPDIPWISTPHLTRSSPLVADDRLFLVGDSIGYVEPFTGEGMSWALATAEAVIPLIESAIRGDWRSAMAAEWTSWVNRHHYRNQRQCRWLARQIRYPHRAACLVRLCNALPFVRAALIKKVVT